MTDAPMLGVSALVIEDDRLLLVRRGRAPAKDQWALPGGRVERGETLIEAVVRELREETGLDGLAGSFVGLNEVIDDEVHAVVITYQVHLLEFAEPRAGDDAAEAAWVVVGDVAEHDLVAGLAELLADHGFIDTYL